MDMEKTIKENLAYFHDQEPDEGHRDRFASKISSTRKAHKKWFSINMTSRIAAAIVILISVSYLILNHQNIVDNDELFITQIEFSDDMIRENKYFDELSSSRIDEIDGKAQSKEEATRLKAVAKKKMELLDANLAMIEKEYMKNPQNEMLKDAIANNKKMKAQVVNNIIEQLDNAQRGYHAGSNYPKF